MEETEKKLTKSRKKWAFLCAAVIVIAACGVGTVLWFTRPPTLEEMTANIPETPSEEWMQRYVDLSRQDLEETIKQWVDDPEAWLAWYEEQPLIDEIGGGKFFISKWLVAIPQGYTAGQTETEDYKAYYVQKAVEDPAFQAVVDLKAPDPRQWWDWFHALPLTDASETSQYLTAKWVVNVLLSYGYPYEELNAVSYNLFDPFNT